MTRRAPSRPPSSSGQALRRTALSLPATRPLVPRRSLGGAEPGRPLLQPLELGAAGLTCVRTTLAGGWLDARPTGPAAVPRRAIQHSPSARFRRRRCPQPATEKRGFFPSCLRSRRGCSLDIVQPHHGAGRLPSRSSASVHPERCLAPTPAPRRAAHRCRYELASRISALLVR
jgi:hypothetical protein